MNKPWKSEQSGISTSKEQWCCSKSNISYLSCWAVASEVDVGGMEVKVEPSHQYSITFHCYVTDGIRGTAWQSCVWHGSAYEAKVWNRIPPRRKSFSNGDNSVRDKPCSGWLCRFWWAWHAWSRSWLMKIHSWWYGLCWKRVFCSWEFALSNSIIVLFLVSMGVDRHYFHSDRHT